jgi:[ribosomal protein S5]-alanine N-acetyltransferase
MTLLLEGEQTARLAFRRIQETDFKLWLPFFESPAAHQHWISEKIEPEQECRNWYARQLQRYENDEGGMNAIIEKSSGDLVGHAGLLRQAVDHVREIEIAYSLLPEFWGKGYATEAAEKCRDYGFMNRLSPSLISIISVSNTPSERVALKVGMKLDKTTLYKSNHVNIFRVVMAS